MLDENELGAYIDQHFTSTLFRMETLDLYDVSSNGDDFRRYLDGEPGPDMSRKGKWLDHIRNEVVRGLHTYRVHVVHGPLTDYLRYEFEWDYVHNAAAGEHIRILDLTEQSSPEGLVADDFWLIGEDHAVVMHYDDEGRFQHGRIVPEGQLVEYRQARDAAWSAAVPFTDYWREHPQYWRDSPAI
ncbi:hypothetical protein FXN61_13935 [Lentzea sp. PSKA42]|uniref:DUF6879 domain-containing protein n=2 Tax=Lentzea indica TaxID=2604800 RepID=A0ABX1FG70_9PSEU|nr:hypothetical protein [Lentzea indica]